MSVSLYIDSYGSYYMIHSFSSSWLNTLTFKHGVILLIIGWTIWKKNSIENIRTVGEKAVCRGQLNYTVDMKRKPWTEHSIILNRTQLCIGLHSVHYTLCTAPLKDSLGYRRFPSNRIVILVHGGFHFRTILRTLCFQLKWWWRPG